MSWKSGSRLMSGIIDILTVELSDFDNNSELRYSIYLKLIPLFGSRDCDTLMECYEQDPEFERALRGLHPEDFVDIDKCKD